MPMFLKTAPLLLGLCLIPSAGLFAQSPVADPRAVVESFDAELVDAMRHAAQLGPAGRYAQLAPAVARTFDTRLMVQHALKRRWSRLTEDQRGRLAEWFDVYSGQSFHVGLPRPGPAGSVLVASRMEGGGGPALPLEYVLARDDAGAWGIVDIRYSGWLSEVERRSSEFTTIVDHAGIEALIARLDAGSRAALDHADDRVSPHLLRPRVDLWSVPLQPID
jgi:ABC-type transporter MlaC component